MADQVDDADADPANELQDLNLADNILTISGLTSPTNINLAPYLDNTDLLAGISASAGQILSYNGSAWVAATDQVNDADADPANELQDLNLTSNILTITGLGNPTPINLAAFQGTNTDEQDLQFVGRVISLTGDPDNTQIDLAPYLELPGTAESGQILSFNGSTWVAGTDQVNDSDSDPENEIQDLFLNTETDLLNITGNASATDIDLSPYRDNTDLLAGVTASAGQILGYNGTTWLGVADQVNDDDSSPTNELQNLSLSGTTLNISDGTGVNLSAFMDNTNYWDLSRDSKNNDFIEYPGAYAKAKNVISGSVLVPGSEIKEFLLSEQQYASSKIVMINSVEQVTIRAIEDGFNGQELILVAIGGVITLDNSMGGSNLILPSIPPLTINEGGTIHLVYVMDEKGGTGFSYWVPISVMESVQVPK